MAQKKKLGSGDRFKAIEQQAAKRGARNPAGVAASIGIKRYGVSAMEQMAAKGKKKR